MPLTDGFSCKCERCGCPHNNIHGDGICLKCRYSKKDIKEMEAKKKLLFESDC